MIVECFLSGCKEGYTGESTKPRRKEVDICIFVDSVHAGDKVSCRSRSGFLIYVDNALVQCIQRSSLQLRH